MFFSQMSKSTLGKVHVKSSILNPLLWLTGIVILTFLPTAYFIDEYRASLLIFSTLPILLTMVAYVYFAFKDPNRLQSEDFQIEHLHMQYMQGKEEPKALLETLPVANPLHIESEE